MAERMPRAGGIACLALTAGGLRLALRLRAAMGASVWCGPRAYRLADDEERALVAGRFARAGEVLPRLWRECNGLVLVVALGAAVRLIAPLLADKRADPAVVVVDDAGRYAISVTGGHRGGANGLAARVATALGASAVITSASDALGLPALDLLGRAQGWRIAPGSDLTGASAALVNGEPVALVRELALAPDPLNALTWPAHVLPVATLAEATPTRFAALLLVSDRAVVPERDLPTVVYHPPTLVAGMGCRRGVSVERLAALLEAALAGAQRSPLALAALATADLKAEEPGLLALAARLGVPLRAYATEALAAVLVPTPAARVARLVGTPSVSEAAALLASGGGALLAPKRVGDGCTVAVARLATATPSRTEDPPRADDPRGAAHGARMHGFQPPAGAQRSIAHE